MPRNHPTNVNRRGRKSKQHRDKLKAGKLPKGCLNRSALFVLGGIGLIAAYTTLL